MRVTVGACLVCGLLVADRSSGQQTESFGEEERVTAIDLVVDPWGAGEAGGKLPKDLSPNDFRLQVGGESRAVVALGAPSLEDLSEAWQVVIYVDEALSTTATVRWASDLLLQHAAEVVSLGKVDLVVAAQVLVVRLTAQQEQ